MESDRNYTIVVSCNSFTFKEETMTLDQLNEFINKGGAAFALLVIAFVLVIQVFRKDIERTSGRKTK